VVPRREEMNKYLKKIADARSKTRRVLSGGFVVREARSWLHQQKELGLSVEFRGYINNINIYIYILNINIKY